MTAPDPLYPKGDRPSCRNGDGRPVYLAGLCGSCFAGSGGPPWPEARCETCGVRFARDLAPTKADTAASRHAKATGHRIAQEGTPR
jgi:hypothetical protein